MALETLKGVTQLDGFDVVDTGNKFVYVRHDVNSISFTLQNGPIKEVGVNGCQVDTMLAAVIKIVWGLNQKFPCKENAEALAYLDSAFNKLKERKANREARGVEGFNKL